MSDVIIKACDFEVKKGRAVGKCGKPVPNNEPTAMTYGTTRYFMDLCEEHQELLKDALAPFTAIASNVEQRRGTQVRKAIQGKKGAFTTADVRAWLRDQGRDVKTDGRIAKELIEEYQAAHGM